MVLGALEPRHSVDDPAVSVLEDRSEGQEVAGAPMLKVTFAVKVAASLALGVGVFLRVALAIKDPLAYLRGCDGEAYWMMAQSLASGKGFALHHDVCGLEAGPSHHFSPLWPLIEAAMILTLGDSTWTLVVSMIGMSLLMIGVVYFLTRDLFGPDAALLVAASQSLEWTSSFYGSRLNYAENLLTMLVALTLWAIIRSVRGQPRMIILAGIFAGLGYLAKAESGWFFLIAICGGAYWRVRHQGWRGLRDPAYLVGGSLFLGIFGIWVIRNLRIFWDGSLFGLLTQWQTSEHITFSTILAIQNPYQWAVAHMTVLPILVFGFWLGVGPFFGPIRNSWSRLQAEIPHLLWLSALVFFLVGWTMAGILLLSEHNSPRWAQTQRFVAPGLLMLWWLCAGPLRESRSSRWLLLLTVLVWADISMPFFLGNFFSNRPFP